MRARQELRKWLDSQLFTYEGVLDMGGPHGDQHFDYSPVLPLLEELRTAAPPPLAEELRAAQQFLSERYQPPFESRQRDNGNDQQLRAAEREGFRLITQWLRAAGDLAAEIPPTTINLDAQIPFTRLREYRHRFMADGEASCKRCSGRINFTIGETDNYPFNEPVVFARCMRCPQAGQFPLHQPPESPWSRGEPRSNAVVMEQPMQKRYEVFISSTFADLENEREKVAQALLQEEFFPSGMEMFPASDESQWSVIRRAIERCDYYVVIVAGRYGSRARDDVSYTEKEYDLADSLGIPVLGFVHRDPDAIPQGKTDKSDDARKRLEDFRNKVRSNRMCSDWVTADELARKVVAGVSKIVRTHPRPGWTRGDVGPRTNVEGFSPTADDVLVQALADAAPSIPGMTPARMQELVRPGPQRDAWFASRSRDESRGVLLPIPGGSPATFFSVPLVSLQQAREKILAARRAARSDPLDD